MPIETLSTRTHSTQLVATTLMVTIRTREAAATPSSKVVVAIMGVETSDQEVVEAMEASSKEMVMVISHSIREVAAADAT